MLVLRPVLPCVALCCCAPERDWVQRALEASGCAEAAQVLALQHCDGLAALWRALRREVSSGELLQSQGAAETVAADTCAIGLVVLDFRLVEHDALAVVQHVRALEPQAALLLVDERPFAAEAALLAGADDFLLLPAVQPEVWRARVRAALVRRGMLVAQARPRRLSSGDCTLDVDRGLLERGSLHIGLTARETAFARCLFESPGQVVPRQRLARLWAMDESLAARSIEQHAYQLRRKLKRCASDQLRLRSIYGQGYRLDCVAERRTDSAHASPFRPPLRVMTAA